MAILNLPWERCWCFRTVRAGSIASAIYAVVCSVFRLVAVILETVVIDEKLQTQADNMTTAVVTQLKVERTMGYVELILAVLLLVAGVCLLIGIFQNIAILLIPFIILFMVTVGIEMLLAVMILLLMLLGYPFLDVFLMLAFVCLFLFIDTSCLLCVISHYLNIRAGREPMRAVYRRQGQRMTVEDEADNFQGEAALPTKEGVPAESVNYSQMSGLPVDGEAPPPYREV